MTQYFRRELQLAINEYSQPAYREEFEALAQTIQNLVILRKGTYPNDPDLGVGLIEYIFELKDSITIGQLQTEIERQIEKFIIHPNIIVSVTIQELQAARGDTTALGITVDLADAGATEGKKHKDIEWLTIPLAFLANRHSKNIVSKLIIN